MQVFFPILWVALSLLIVLRCTEVLIFDVVQFISFSFVACVFGVVLKQSLPDSIEVLSLYFVLGVLGLTLSYSFWVNFCLWCTLRIQLHSSGCGHLVFSAPFVDKTDLYPLKGLGKSMNFKPPKIIFNNCYWQIGDSMVRLT